MARMKFYSTMLSRHTIGKKKEWNDQEFFEWFQFVKNTIASVILPQIENPLQHDRMRCVLDLIKYMLILNYI